jgi:hypothetical protein
LNDGYPSSYGKFNVVVKFATHSIVDVYRSAVIDPTESALIRLRIMNYLFLHPRELERVYSMENFANAVMNSWDQLKSLFSKARPGEPRPHTTLEGVISDPEMLDLIKSNEEVIGQLWKLFLNLWVSSYFSS